MTSTPTRRAIASRTEFHDAIGSALAHAAVEGAREIWLCDSDFADWPLSEREVIDDLTRWARSPRRLMLFAHSFDAFSRRHGRWLEWRRQWSHVVECRGNDELEAAEFPTICLLPGLISVRLFDTVRHRGMASHDAADLLASREAIDVVSQRSSEALPVTTLGL